MSDNVPQCVGIIMDGNRRWANEKKRPTLQGHREGLDRLEDTVRWLGDRGVKHLIVYAFSTENWNREEEEVSYLMSLIKEAAKTRLAKFIKEGARVRVVGQRSRLSPDVLSALEKSEEKSKDNTAITMWACLSYGGRQEIVEAARALCNEGKEITEESLSSHLWTAEMPDPDLIIRTGGEKRLSNFLPWQATYAELFFIDEYWPDFSEALLDKVLKEYAERDRRWGR